MSSPKLSLKDLATLNHNVPPNQPIVMLNLLRFKDQAQYPSSSDLQPCSGKEAYTTHYRNAFQKVTAGLGHSATVVFIGQAHASLLAASDADDKWDLFALVEYSNFGVLKEILESKAYLEEAKPHHNAAVEDWKFMLTTKIGP